MNLDRPLRGSCACRRNQYFIRAPQGVDEVAQVIFGTDPSHRIAQANFLAAHIRVPLDWFHSATFALYPDETASMIRRVYENHFEPGHARRHFCGFCGTPLTFWCEQPRSEADYIQVTLGSLCREDLGDLEEMGLISESPIEQGAAPTMASTAPRQVGRETLSIPWIDTLVEGSSLGGRLKTTMGTRQSADGTTRVEWEIVEYTADGNEDEDADGDDNDNDVRGHPLANNGKRKLDDQDDGEDAQMEGVSQS